MYFIALARTQRSRMHNSFSPSSTFICSDAGSGVWGGSKVTGITGRGTRWDTWVDGRRYRDAWFSRVVRELGEAGTVRRRRYRWSCGFEEGSLGRNCSKSPPQGDVPAPQPPAQPTAHMLPSWVHFWTQAVPAREDWLGSGCHTASHLWTLPVSLSGSASAEGPPDTQPET